MATANHVLLQRITLTNSTTTAVIFDSIPQTGYTDLKLNVSGRFSSGAGFNLINFNGLSTANFSNKVLEGTGTSVVSFVNGSTNYAGALNGSSDTANTFSNQEIYIPNYTSSNFKFISFDAVMEHNGATAYQDLAGILWSNTAAITSIRLQTHTGAAYAAGSSFSLYGIANAATTPAAAPKADGGDIIRTDGTYWYHAFTSTGIFKPQLNLTADVLVVAGGGGTCTAAGNWSSGGGGAGGYRAITASSFTVQNYPVVVGAGGTASSGAPGGNGSNSSISTISATGGGGGAQTGLVGPGSSGGSGGGHSGTSAGSGNAGGYSPVEGYAGGSATGRTGSGGGGASQVGFADSYGGSSGNGGAGGAGLSTAISGGATTGLGQFSSGSYYFAGGGGGGDYDTATVVPGGVGGGGAGGRNGALAGTAGTANTGGGAGGPAPASGAGAAGGSGVVIIRYPV